jgi:hypothetical protein
MAFADVCVVDKRSNSANGVPVFDVPSDGHVTLTMILKNGYCDSSQVQDLTGVSSVKFIAKESANAIARYIDKTMTIVSAPNGEVSVTLHAADLPFAGLWFAGVVGYNANSEVMFSSKLWLNVEKTSAHSIMENTPLSAIEIRTFL